MTTAVLNAAGSVKLNGSGNGTVTLGPRSAETWQPAAASVSTVSQAAFPQCSVYQGAAGTAGQLVDSTYTGNSDATSKFAGPVYHGQYISAVWTGGTPGDTATLVLTGTRQIGGP